jgi:hypothetical protein
MKRTYLLLMRLTIVILAVGHAVALGQEREAKQAELDAACEAARQESIITRASKAY